MTKESLGFISDLLSDLEIPYQFEEWTTNPVPDPYFIGEYIESESPTKEENGQQESTFILTGTGQSWLGLQEKKDLIENNISKTAILDNGNGIAVFYRDSRPVPTGDYRLKRIEINLTITEWSVNQNGNW